MRHTSLLWILLTVPASSLAQEFFPAKDLAFAQIAAGGGYETVLNISNRGTSAYSGTLTLYPTDRTKPLPLLVNGNAVSSGGTISLTVDRGATTSLRITSSDASLGTLSGFATIADADRLVSSLLEGNLTYYVKAADGTIVDSVGVAPSVEVFQAVIPFDDFLTVALALANRNAASQQATVKLTVFDDKNVQVGTTTQLLANNQQVARFLYQYFPSASLTKGRVEIQSDRLFLGTALTFVKGNQASSLPFLASEKVYSYSFTALGQTQTGKFFLAVAGPHVSAYGDDAAGIQQACGILKNGNLELFSHVGRGTSTELIVYSLITNFNPSLSTQSGTVVFYTLNPAGLLGQGTITVTASN
jgi:hypothetical protein